MKLREALIGGAALVVIGLVLYPVFEQPRDGHRRSCLSHVKQLATANLIYLDDSNGNLMLEDWHTALWPYVKSEEMFDCVELKAPARYGYAYHLALLGKRTEQFPSESTVLFFETDALGRSLVANLAGFGTTRHDNRSAVAYLDSHAMSFRHDAKP